MAGRERTGSVTSLKVNGKKVWIARVRWINKDGDREDWKRRYKKEREANDAVADKLTEIDKSADRPVEAQTVTMKQLGEHRKETDFIKPEFDDHNQLRKGLISWKEGRRKVDFLVERFGPETRIRAITYGDLKKYCNARLGEYKMVIRYVKKANGHRQSFTNAEGKREFLKEAKPESLLTIATVRRELAELHTLFEIAKTNNWLDVNPFALGKKLLRASQENQRDMIINLAHATALLDAAKTNEFAPHLFPILVLAFDTGCRPVEWQRLKVGDVNFDQPPANPNTGTVAGSIQVRSYKGGRLKPRLYALTVRMRRHLLEWCAGKGPTEFVFAHRDGRHKGQPIKSLKNSFNSAKKLAALDGIDLNGFRLYDIRHTTATRLGEQGFPEAFIGDFLGHTQASTTKRYINPDHTSRIHAAQILEHYTGEETDLVN